MTDQQPGLTTDELLELYRRMLRVRRFELTAAQLYRAGTIPGFVHLAVGQEASAIGATYLLRADDVMTSTHRGHGHALGRGLSSYELMAELLGRVDGVCHGRGGSMHVADPTRGIFGANGIVAAGIPLAGGAALAARLRGTDGVALAFLGDGALSTGAFHEAANLAALWHLPLVLFCEDNGFAEFSAASDTHPVTLETRAHGLGLEFRTVDGNDVAAVVACMREVLAVARSGGGPVVVEARTARVGGHYEGDPQIYRDGEATLPDPLEVARDQLIARGVAVETLDAVVVDIDAELEESVRTALLSPEPDPSDLARFVLVERAAPVEPAVDESGTWKYFEAIGTALQDSLAEDDRTFLMGIDVGRAGNVFALTRGLHERWPDRVRDTPISETAIMGYGVGAAMAGLRPIVELMYFDFLGVCLDPIMNQAAKLPFMTGGKARVPLVIRTQSGAGRSSGAQHSQSLEGMLAAVPGLTVVMPSTAADAYGLLRSAIEDDNPVIVVENRLLYGTRGPRIASSAHRTPIGVAAQRVHGDDVTVVSWSRMASVAVEAAGVLAAEGISVDVIDLRTIAPLDMTPILESVARTSRLVIVHEAHHDFGPGAEIAARMASEGLHLLDAPVLRVAPPHVPAPYAPSLERVWLPGVDDVVAAVRRLAAF